jgi:DNA-binding NtrC family response regulator
MQSILIVDDDKTFCMILKEELEEVGYNANFLNNGFEAIEYLLNNPVDLVFLDLQMPEMDGFDVLKSLEQHKIKTKVIVLTGYADIEEAVDPERMVTEDFITKPYDFDELLIAIRRVLQKE